MPDDGRSIAALRPVAAGHVLVAGGGAAIGLRAGEDVVPVRAVAPPVDHLAFLVEPGLFVDFAVGMEVVDVARDFLALRVLPRAFANSIPGIDFVGTEVRPPLALPSAGGFRQRLAMPVSALEPAEIGALAGPGAGDEEGHVLLLRLRARCCEQGDGCDEGFHDSANTPGAKIFQCVSPSPCSSLFPSIWYKGKRRGPFARSASSCLSLPAAAPTSWAA